MDVKEGGVYLHEKNGERHLIKLIRTHELEKWSIYWLADAISLETGGLLQDFFAIDEITTGFDPKVWDKAIKIHEVYMSSLKSIIETK